MYDILIAHLILFVFNTATFMYLTIKVVDYLNWKRAWRINNVER